MSNAVTNGRPQRKQLSDQIAKLEALLDGLGEGLNDAIADACKEGTRAAVKEAIAEVLTHPDLRTLIRPAAQELAASRSRPSLWSRVSAKVAEIKVAVAALAARAVSAVQVRCWTAGESAATTARTLGAAWRARRLMLAGLAGGGDRGDDPHRPARPRDRLHRGVRGVCRGLAVGAGADPPAAAGLTPDGVTSGSTGRQGRPVRPATRLPTSGSTPRRRLKSYTRGERPCPSSC